MYQLGDAWRRAWAAPDHRVTARFEPLGFDLVNPTVLGGSVQVDGGAPIRRQANSIELRLEEAVDQIRQGGWLNPYGGEFRLWRGLELADGSILEAPLGVFVITGAQLHRSSDGSTSATISGTDRAIRIQRARWDHVFQPQALSARSDALAALLADRWPDVQTDIEDDADTLGIAVYTPDPDSDPWADAQKLASAMGQDLAFDRNGIAVSVSPVETTRALASYVTDETSPITELDRGITNDLVYTGVIASGQSNVGGARAEAWDDDPTSPTYYLGPVGKVPYFVTSPHIKTHGQAVKAANQQLTKLLGASETVGWSMIADPTLDPVDTVAVTDTASGTEGLFVVDTIELPLLEATMTVTARTRRWAR
jgi:hypothetical protein